MTLVEQLLAGGDDRVVAPGELVVVGGSGAGRDAAGPPSTATRGAGDVGTGRPGDQAVPARYRDIFGVREWRAIFTAELGSMLGDQVAAVALAVLLYERSGSPLVAALGYASAFLPWALGGPLLSVLADRLPARRVMVGCDLARASLIGLAAVPGLPLPVLGLLVVVAAFLAPPFDAATSALLPQVLDGEAYALGVSLRSTAANGAMLAGFAGGGLLVALITPYGALALDAATFALSALWLARRLAARPAALADAAPATLRADALEGLRVVAADRRRYGPLLLGMAGAAYLAVPEGIATAYAHLLGYGAPVVGVLMASVAAGHVLGSLAVGRLLTTARRNALMWPMAFAGTVPLVCCALDPGLGWTVVLFVLAGGCSAFQVAANTSFTAAVPVAARGRAFGLAMTGMYAVQCGAIVLGGAAAQIWAPNAVVAGLAVVGAVVLLGLRAVSGPSTVRPARPPRAHRALR